MVLFPVALVSGLGLIFGLILSYASVKFEVKVDDRIAKVREAFRVQIAVPAVFQAVIIMPRPL